MGFIRFAIALALFVSGVAIATKDGESAEATRRLLDSNRTKTERALAEAGGKIERGLVAAKKELGEIGLEVAEPAPGGPLH